MKSIKEIIAKVLENQFFLDFFILNDVLSIIEKSIVFQNIKFSHEDEYYKAFACTLDIGI